MQKLFVTMHCYEFFKCKNIQYLESSLIVQIIKGMNKTTFKNISRKLRKLSNPVKHIQYSPIHWTIRVLLGQN
jgi:hypothetical protein